MRVGRFARLFETRRDFCSRWIPLIVGSVLLTAAALKALAFVTDSTPGRTLLESTWFRVLLVEVELACGLALWLDLFPRITRGAALLLFVGFFGVALSQALRGARSCACFGTIESQPWLAVVLDAAMLATLLWWKPGKGNVATFSASKYAAIVLLAVLPIFAVSMSAFTTVLRYPRLEISPGTVKLGTLQQGRRYVFRLDVRNPHDEPVTITHVSSTCACLKARGLPLRLEPRNHALLVCDRIGW